MIRFLELCKFCLPCDPSIHNHDDVTAPSILLRSLSFAAQCFAFFPPSFLTPPPPPLSFSLASASSFLAILDCISSGKAFRFEAAQSRQNLKGCSCFGEIVPNSIECKPANLRAPLSDLHFLIMFHCCLGIKHEREVKVGQCRLCLQT